MGLDMYLTASRYLSNWDHAHHEDKARFVAIHALSGLPKAMLSLESPSGEVTFIVGYWRKANAIHSWFVKHVQKGIDECVPHDVSRSQLEELHKQCLLAQQTKSAESLPPSAGFFFGSTEVGEYYWECIQQTIEIIGRCLSLPAVDWKFAYQSSW